MRTNCLHPIERLSIYRQSSRHSARVNRDFLITSPRFESMLFQFRRVYLTEHVISNKGTLLKRQPTLVSISKITEKYNGHVNLNTYFYLWIEGCD